MAVTVELYPKFFENALNGNINDLEGVGNLECLLLNGTHTFSDANQFVADIVANEISDVDYSRVALTSVAVTQGTAADSNKINVDCGNITFGSAVTITASHAVIFHQKTNDSDSILMFDINFGGSQESVDGEFTLEIHTDGLYDLVT